MVANLATEDAFDEFWYLQNNEDVAAAVARGDWPSGLAHYTAVGKEKGRSATPTVNESWYHRTYPLAADEIRAGRASNPTDHYLRIGRYRGYVPDAKTRRPKNSADFRSKFGGLWTDQSNSADLIAGRLDIGTISKSQSEMLFKWVDNGYLVLNACISDDVLEFALADLDKAYDGQMSKLKFSVKGVGEQNGWIPEARTNPTKALDIHWFSPAVRDLIFAPKILEFLHLVFERRALASQSLGFLRGSAQDAHQDSAYVNYSLPMQFVASWIALEDVTQDAGELFYYRGSHRMPEFLYGGQFKGTEEARRLGADRNINTEVSAHIRKIADQASAMKLKKETLLAKKGDVLFWSADLAHGGCPISKSRTRKSIVTHYCPAEVVPTFVEYRTGVPLKSHRGQAYYTSWHYANVEPE